MKMMKPKKYTKSKEVICDWIDKKNYFIHDRIFKFYVRHGIVVEKFMQ